MLGNKVFVLIISYTIAMKWYFDVSKQSASHASGSVKGILQALVNEPINIGVAAGNISASGRQNL